MTMAPIAAGECFNSSKYPQGTPEVTVGTYSFDWDGLGSVVLSLSTTAQTCVYVDDNFQCQQLLPGYKHLQTVSTISLYAACKLFNITSILYTGANLIEFKIINSAGLSISYSWSGVDPCGQAYWIYLPWNGSGVWLLKTYSAGWVPRFYHSSVALSDGSIVVMGGGDLNSTRLRDVWRSTDKGATWVRQTATAEWSARWAHTSVALPDDSIVLMGGNDGVNDKNDVWRSTDMGAHWTQLAVNAEWVARWAHTSVVMPDGSIVLMGGDPGAPKKNDVWRSTNNGANWTQMKPNDLNGWTKRYGHTCVAMKDGSIVLLGGNDGIGTLVRNDVWKSIDNGANWSLVKPDDANGWSRRAFHRSEVRPDGSIVVFGGQSNDGAVNDTWQSADGGATWTQINPGAGWTPRCYHASAVTPDGNVVLTGGYNNGIDFWNDAWVLPSRPFVDVVSGDTVQISTISSDAIITVVATAWDVKNYGADSGGV